MAERTLTLTKTSGTGYGVDQRLGWAPREGVIEKVTARLDATLNDMVTGRLIIFRSSDADPTFDGTVDEGDQVYRSELTTFTGSATVLSIEDEPPGTDGAYYDLADGEYLWAGIQVVSAGGGGASTSVDARIGVRGLDTHQR